MVAPSSSLRGSRYLTLVLHCCLLRVSSRTRCCLYAPLFTRHSFIRRSFGFGCSLSCFSSRLRSIRKKLCRKLGRDAAVSDPLGIECDHLVQVTVAFDFLLVLLDGIEKMFQQIALTTPLLNRRGGASRDACREINQRSKLLDLPVASSKRRQCKLFILECINGRA
ncbi:hypothetical protein LMG28690_03469 [Paraburkholderia caffeinilytica]|nr:hypothetical protein LMG28690_03469 [Paraburkholderia caffeinilytica]